MADEPSRDQLLSRRLVDGAKQALDEPRELTLEAVADSVGLDVDQLRRTFEAAGRLRETGYGERDLAYARVVEDLLRLFGEDELVRGARVRTRAMSQVVVNDLTTVSTALQRLEEQSDVDDVDALTELLVAAAAHITPNVEQLLVADYRERLLRLLEADVVGDSSRAAADGSLDLAVGFADLVGYTRLSATIDPEGLTDVLTSFEALVHDVVDDHGDILIAKFIGDAAMLVSGEAERLGAALIDVVEADVAALDGVPRRAGFAFGSVLVREGDYYGAAVNLAARLTDLARPESVLVAPETVDLLTDRWRPRRTRPMKVKGVGTIQPYRLRRDDDGAHEHG